MLAAEIGVDFEACDQKCRPKGGTSFLEPRIRLAA